MTTRRTKRLLVVAPVAAALGVAAFALMVAKDRSYVPSEPYAPRGAPNRDVVVVYYSRSGHSEAVAREVARPFNAPAASTRTTHATSRTGKSAFTGEV